jgi:hypothetical protein
MTGNVTVTDQSSSVASQFDTIGLLMVPTINLESVEESMRSAGFGIDSTHAFTDLRGGQEDTGDRICIIT